MTLDVEIPDPPSFREPQDPGDYDAVDEPEEWVGDDGRREELQSFLEDGAWADAFDEWRDSTGLTEAEYELVLEFDLLEEFDWYWNRTAEDVGYRAPTLPDDFPSPFDDSAESVDVGSIEGELDDLGRTVSEVLENDYVLRDSREFGFFADR